MNTIVITGRGPVDCPGFFHFGPLRTALVEARRVVLVHSWTYDANKDLKRFLYRQNKRVLDTLSIEHFLSFTDVTHAVTLNVEVDPPQQRKYRTDLQLKWKTDLRTAKELWKRWDHWHDFHKLGPGCTARTITSVTIAENLLSRTPPSFSL